MITRVRMPETLIGAYLFAHFCVHVNGSAGRRDRHCRSWVEIRPGALRRNLRRIRNAVGASSAIIPVVKADGYGLGMESVVRALEPEDPWGYGVATVEEGARLRAAGVAKPIVVMSPFHLGHTISPSRRL